MGGACLMRHFIQKKIGLATYIGGYTPRAWRILIVSGQPEKSLTLDKKRKHEHYRSKV